MAFDVQGMARWHHAIHQVTGDMAKFFGPQLTPEKIVEWSDQLKVVAAEMDNQVYAMMTLEEVARKAETKKKRKKR